MLVYRTTSNHVPTRVVGCQRSDSGFEAGKEVVITHGIQVLQGRRVSGPGASLHCQVQPAVKHDQDPGTDRSECTGAEQTDVQGIAARRE